MKFGIEDKKLYYKYNDKLNLLCYSVDNKEREADSKRWIWERKKDVHSYSIKLFISEKFEKCSARL